MAFLESNRPAVGAAVRRAVMAACAAVALLAPAPAAAQWVIDDPMSPRAVTRILARQGFTELAAPRLTGDVYVVPAIDEDGARVRLVVDAYSGRILRQVGVSVERLPPRPMHRLRPWDYTPEPDDEIERRPIEPYRERRWSRGDLMPPAPVGRAPAPELPLSRDGVIDLDQGRVESARPRPVERDKRPTAARSEPPRRAARVEQPASPAQPQRSLGDERAAPATPAHTEPSAQPTDAAADTKNDVKPAVTAAVPAPAPAKDEPAPAPAPSGDKPAMAQPGKSPASPEPAVVPPSSKARTAARAAEPSARDNGPGKVRIIGGVAPVVPQKPGATDEGSSSEPTKIAE